MSRFCTFLIVDNISTFKMLRNIFFVTLIMYTVGADDLGLQDVQWDALSPEEHFNVCDVCKWIVETVKKEITPQSSQAEIKTLLHAVCGAVPFPPPFSSLCNFIVDKYVDILAREISKADPPTVCAAIKLC
ncbi:proactivator polypeptide-like 1 isoform X1 [Triplophysa rosa]|uniref:proactivator polypeptide-like 1 isoform X1 n=1 Tax=Triplophysa rosa TaxID=992332 RepID=UPI0025463197|nr:proactivator polypeptide-like 1 isoform X1 [Triplophysa rosa]XP_057200577.1 proactivator polypeptide-like 1 isoform X2 [Triplophysa rosa]XP_057200578.1 proactivator polypeptide-like 1 isoform X1 [Triplophysa rosa]